MKNIFALGFIFISTFIYANPKDCLQVCISWIGRSEASLIQSGAIDTNNDVDLRGYGMHLLKHYVWNSGNIGYFAQVSDGIIIATEFCLKVSGINEGRLQLLQYNNKDEFDADAEFIRQMVYSYSGSLWNLRETSGIRTITYRFSIDDINVDISVFSKTVNPEQEGYGWIIAYVKRG